MSAMLAAAALTSCAATAPAPADSMKPRWGVALDGYPITAEQLATVTRETTLAPRLVVFFQQWPEDAAHGEFPAASLAAIAAAGAEPVITWEPMYYRRSDGAETMISAASILAGAYDGYLEDYAQRAAAWGRPLIIRFAHEMNLQRYHWGTAAASYGAQSPEIYRQLWRHVVGVFRRAGAKNVRWAFCPNVESVPGVGNARGAEWNGARAYFPGPEWVDLIGVDGYNWGNSQTQAKHGWNSSWRGVADTFGRIRGELSALVPGKPFVIFETATAPGGGDKAAWLAELGRVANEWQLYGVVWFHANKEVDWRLHSAVAPGALALLRAKFETAERAK